jgi:hypothetical protein
MGGSVLLQVEHCDPMSRARSAFHQSVVHGFGPLNSSAHASSTLIVPDSSRASM